MGKEKYDSLKLKNQLCFPLYAVSKEIVKRYRPFLEEIDLTYTQYIVMMVLWEKKTATVKEIGEELFLDSGTLTPVLKSLEQKGYISRVRNSEDERSLDVSLTPDGVLLRDKALSIPSQIAQCVHLSPEDAYKLYEILYKLLGEWNGNQERQ